MQSWQTVVVCVTLAVVCSGVGGHPRALEDSVLGQVKENVDQTHRWFPAENTGKIIEEEPKKISRSASREEDDPKKINIMKDDQLGMPLVVDAEKKKEDETKVENTPEIKIEQKEDDSIRSKKSPDMRDISYRGAPMTMCVQVYSHHHPSVVCGPQVKEEKQEDQTAPRLASPDFYNPRYFQEPQGSKVPPSPARKTSGPLYVRVNPDDIERYNPANPPNQRGMISPIKTTAPAVSGMPQPVTSPKAARGPYGLRRTQPEDDNTLKPSEGAQPNTPIQPLRIIPQGSPSSPSLLVRQQYFQSAPISHYPSNLITSLPSATPLRFNCALQPDGAQFVQTYGSPLLRSSASAGMLPLGEVIPDMPIDMQGFYLNPQGRAAQPDDMLEYADPWVGTTFVGEDGQLYQIDGSQSRAAANEEETPKLPKNGVTVDDLNTKYDEQTEQLRMSSRRLEELEKKLKDMQRSMTADEDKKKHTPAVDPSKEIITPTREPSEPEEHKKQMPSKNTKRNTYRHERK